MPTTKRYSIVKEQYSINKPPRSGLVQHPNMMQISLESISYFESRGKAVSIVTRDKNEIALILHLYFEGENALIFKHFILSEDGKSLSVVDDDLEIESIYYRCPD